jgi:tetratricopeptide (TPR) repeat protein
VLDPEDKAKKCDLLLALGHALILAGEQQRVINTEAPQAFSLAEAITDNRRASRACLLAMHGLTVYGSQSTVSPEAAQWAVRADRYAEPDTIERAWADAILGWVKWSGVSPSSEVVGLVSRALHLARRLGDPDTYWWIASLWLSTMSATQHDEERLRLVEELTGQSRAGVNVLTLSFGLWGIANQFLTSGMRHHAEDIMAEMKTLAERSGQPNLLILSMINDATMAIWDGRLEEAVAIRRHIMVRAEELDIVVFAAIWASFVIAARVHLGDAGRALERVLQDSRNVSHHWGAVLLILFCLAHLGRYAEVKEMLEQMVVARPGIGSTEDETILWLDIALLEAAVLAEHRQAAELLFRRLTESSSCTSGFGLTTCIGRHMGAAAALLGRPDEARKYYQKAIKDCTEMKFRPELALTRLQLAELLLQHYPNEKKEALDHLDFAIKEFQDMKMQPSLERALRHKEILKA